MSRHRWWFLTTLGLIFALMLAACGGQVTEEPAEPATLPTEAVVEEPAEEPMATEEGAVTEEQPTAEEGAVTEEQPTAEEGAAAAGELRTPQEAALAAAGGEELGGSVSVLGTWGGSEQESFLAMVQPFEEATGVDVVYEGTRDLNAVLTTRVEGGNPPDLAGLPGPGQMAQFAQQGQLINLSEVLNAEEFAQDYGQTWVDLGTVNNELVGVFIKASAKGLIWYSPQVWNEQGVQIPATWEEMMATAQNYTGTDIAPWCIGLESGAASGWPGTDWIEDIVLRQSGPGAYEDWYNGELAWTSPEIREAWQTWGLIVAEPQMVYGGPTTMLTTAFGNAGDPLFSDPPNCLMHHQASFISDFFVENNPDLQPGQDFDFFSFPPFDAGSEQSLVVAGDLFGMFNDTPQARALIQYLTTPEAQSIWVERGGAISPNQRVALESYPDDLARKSAELLTSAEIVVFDASDLMPESMNNAFWNAVLNYVQSPGDLERILEELDSVQAEAYE